MTNDIQQLDLEFEDDGKPLYPTPYSVDLFELTGAALKNYMDQVLLLPKSLVFVIKNHSIGRMINEQIAPQFHLTEDQIKELTRVVRDVLLSMLYAGDLVPQLSARLRVDEPTAQQIANVLVAQVFKPAMDDIKAMQLNTFPDRIGQKSPEQEGNVINLRDRTF